MSEARPRSSFLHDVGATIIGNLASPLIGIVTSPLLAHALGVRGRGQFAAATSPTLLLVLAGTVGLPEAATFLVASGRLRVRVVLSRTVVLSLIFGAAFTAAVIAVAPLISTREPATTALLRAGACSLPLALVVGVIRGAAAGHHRWKLVNAEKLLGNAVRLVLVVILTATSQLNLPLAVAVYLLAPVFAGFVYVRFCFQQWQESNPPPRTRTGSTGILVRYGAKTWVGSLTGIVLYRLDQVLIAPLAGSRQLGLYAAAVAIGEIPYVVSGATRDVLLASDASRSDDAQAAKASRLTLLATGVLGLALAVAAPLLVKVAFGSAFDGATPMLVLLLIAAVLYTPGSTAGSLLLARGLPTARSLCLAAGCAANVIGLFLLVPSGGGLGAAWASVIGYSIYTSSALTVVARRLGIPPWAMVAVRTSDVSTLSAVIRRKPQS